MRILMKDGAEFDLRPGGLIDIPADHDAWALGDEPCEMLSWMSGRTWLRPLHTLKERVLVTILLTDIVASSGLVSRLGD